MDTLLKTLADEKRREILRLVWSDELGATEIAQYFPNVTRTAISQQLSLMKRVGLLTERRQGTHRFYRAQHREVLRVQQFLNGYWSDSLLRLKELAEAIEKGEVTA